MSQVVDILVPVVSSFSFGIAPGSAILTEKKSNLSGLRKTYYEGNLFGAVNLESFEERLIVAGGRMKDNCPTVAKTYLLDADIETHFKKVGEYDLSNWTSNVTDPGAIDDWCLKAA